VIEEISRNAQASLRSSKVDFDVPTIVRNQQKAQPRMVNPSRDLFGDDEQFDIPTFLRKRVD
jgi:cell division protein FtsZ